MLQVECVGCGKTYKAPEKFAGKKMRCKQCGNTLLIPEPVVDDGPPEAAESEPQAEPLAERQPRKDLEETAVLDAKEREELERTRPRARREFGKRRLGQKPATGRAVRGAGKGVKARPGSTRRPSRGARARGRKQDDGAAAPETGSRMKFYVVAATSALLVLAVLVVAYIKFVAPPAPEPSGGGVAGEGGSAEPPARTEEEETPGLPSARMDPLGLIPGNVDVLISISRERLETLLPAHATAEDAEAEESEFVKEIEEGVQRVWGGLVLPADLTAAPEDVELVVVLEGDFQEPEETLATAQEEGLLAETAVEHGRLRAYALTEQSVQRVVSDVTKAGSGLPLPGAPAPGGEDESPAGAEGGAAPAPPGVTADAPPELFMAFVTRNQVVVTTESVLPKLAQLVDGEGESVKTSARLRSLLAEFHYDRAFRLGVVVPSQLAQTIADLRQQPQWAGIPQFDQLSVSVDGGDSPGGGVQLDLRLLCPSEEEAQKGEQFVLGFRGMLAMTLFAEPEQKEVLKKLVPKASGAELAVTFALSADEMKELAMPSMPGDGAGEAEFEEEAGDPLPIDLGDDSGLPELPDDAEAAESKDVEKGFEDLENQLREELESNGKVDEAEGSGNGEKKDPGPP